MTRRLSDAAKLLLWTFLWLVVAMLYLVVVFATALVIRAMW